MTSQNDWDWPVAPSQQQHIERFALLRPIPYEIGIIAPPDQNPEDLIMSRRGKGLSVNISSGGILLLMNRIPEPQEVMKVYVPTPVNLAQTPTLAEVRWRRVLPFVDHNGDSIYFVGLKFVF